MIGFLLAVRFFLKKMYLPSMVKIYIVFVLFSIFVDGYSDFWFVSDFHVDQNYSRTGNPANLCHEDTTLYPDAGFYGNFLCDSPISLINASVEAMKIIQPNPDFIIWTGDNLPHTTKFDPDWEVVFEAIGNITFLLSTTFPNVPVFPCIGNHDTFPPNILLPTEISDTVYEGYLMKGGWNKFLSKNASFYFLQGGFYSELIKPGLRLISLNTILWYTPNKFTAELNDPANQFEWLQEILRKSSLQLEKVYIIGHVPPGYYNRVKPGKKSDPTFHIHFLETYLKILHKYSKIIIGQMYGHLHMDMFQLFQFGTGSFQSSSILASSVTPWHFIDSYNTSLPVNPSIRLMHYSDSDFSLLDYEQFYMNLSKVNNQDRAHKGKKELYELLYKFTELYDVPDLSTESLTKVFELLKKNETLFKDFFKYLSAGKVSVNCLKDCKIAQLCAMSATSEDEYNLCMSSVDEKDIFIDVSSSIAEEVTIIVVVIFAVAILLLIFTLYLKCKKSYNQIEYENFLNF